MTYSHILLPVDLNTKASWKKALPEAVKLAEMHSATLHIMTVVPDFGMTLVGSYFPKDFEKKALDHAEEALQKFAADNLPKSLEHRIVVAHGTIYEQIIRAADEIGADLIVMASHRPELQDYLIGPNAARVVRHAKQSVMIVRE